MRNWLWSVLLALAMWSAPAQARWLRAETPNFVVYSQGSEKSLRDAATLLEDYDRLLRELTRLDQPPAPSRLTVYLVGSPEDLLRYTSLGQHVLGYYHTGPEGVAAFALRNGAGDLLDGQQVLLHEYAHHFMLQYFPSNYPGWYIEGFAEYLMTAKFKPATIEYGGINVDRALSLTRGEWLPMAKLLTGDHRSFGDTDNEMFYAQSWALVHYVFSTPARSASFRTYLGETAKGTDAAAALHTAFDMDYKHFDSAVRQYITGTLNYTIKPRGSDRAPVAVAVTPLPASADALLLEYARLSRPVADKFAPSLLASVRRHAARFPDDPFALRVAALAETKLGDRAAGTAMLDRLIAANPADAELLYQRGSSELAAARQDKAQAAAHLLAARPFFARAHKADPNHFPSLFRYAETYVRTGAPASENIMNVLLLAHQLAPQVAEISLNTAAMLTRRGRFDEAHVLLDPLINDPHGREAATVARAMATRIDQKQPVDGWID